MTSTPTLSADSLVLVLLCTTTAAPRAVAPPFSAHAWSNLWSCLQAAGIQRPGELLDADLEALGPEARLTTEQVERLKSRLGRADAARAELTEFAERGIWVLTSADSNFPLAALSRLGNRMPHVLFGVGKAARLQEEGVAVVGSRDVDADGAEYATRLGELIAEAGLNVISGGARGVDLCAMNGALEAGGGVLGVLADRLDTAAARTLPEHRDRLTLVTCVHPRVGFSRSVAMQRNRVIHALGRYTVTVSSAEYGGTWIGSTENLLHGWSPLLVRTGPRVRAGNRKLIERGAYPLPTSPPGSVAELLGHLHQAGAAR